MATANPVMLLGDVCEVKEVREGTRDQQRLIGRHARELCRERIEVFGGSAPRAFRQRANPFDGPKQIVPLQGAERFAQQLAELPNVIP